MLWNVYNLLTGLWMRFLAFMFVLTWPFGFLGYYLDPMHAVWIRAVWFGGGAIVWALVFASIVQMALYDNTGMGGLDAEDRHVVEILVVCGWGLFCIYYLFRIFSA